MTGLPAALQLEGAAVVITGAGAGIGRATALAAASCGGTVVALDRDADALVDLAAEVAAEGGRCETETVDATDADSVEGVRDAIAERHPQIAGLVNVVGINDHTPLTSLPLERWERVITTNLTSVFLITRAFAPLLQDGRASIVNIASSYGLVGNPKTPAYCASKGGVANLSRQLAVDLASRGIRVNAVCPGPTMTPRLKGYFDSGQSNPENARSTTLLGRFAEPHEIGNVVAFLLTPAASYVDGSVIAVDGGQTCHTGAIAG